MHPALLLFPFSLFSVADKWAPTVGSLLRRIQNAPRIVQDPDKLPQALCTQNYTQSLFYFYKIKYLEICGILYIKIHGL